MPPSLVGVVQAIGGRVVQSVLSPGVRVNSFAEVDLSILFSEVNVGRHSRLRRCIVERGVEIPENTQIGYDIETDRESGFTVTDSGIVVVSRESPLTEREKAEVASLS